MKLDNGACAFGAGIILEHKENLAGEVEHLLDQSGDIEHIHDARVASRRLRATLPLFDSCVPGKKEKKWLKRIQKVTGALGEARDTDVQLELLINFARKLPEAQYRPGINRLILRLRQKRNKLQEPVNRAIEKLKKSQVLEEMQDELKPMANQEEQVYFYTPALYQHSFQSIQAGLEKFLSYEQVVNHPENDQELHQMRIAAKKLRYTLETFAPLYANQLKPYVAAVRKTQDLLGEIHDCDVWAGLLPQFYTDERQRTIEYFGYERPFKRLIPGLLYFQQDRQRVRGELYQQFVEVWQQWQAQALWTELLHTIQVPFLQPDSLYPPGPPPPQPPPPSPEQEPVEQNQ